MANLTGPIDIGIKDGNEISVWQSATKIWAGGAVGVVMGVGYATPLRVGTADMQFIGVSLETSDNTLGTPGSLQTGVPGGGISSVIRLQRKGLAPFAQTGTAITSAHMELKVYFADDQTITLTPGTCYAGQIAAVDQSGAVWVDISNAVYAPSQQPWIPLSGNADAISPNVSADYIITTAGVDAMTLAAPTATTDDGKTIVVSSSTSNAHTLTATALLQTGTASVNLATFAAQKGAGLTLKAYQGKWQVICSVGITFS